MERIIVGDETFTVQGLLSSVWSFKVYSKTHFMIIEANSEFLSELVSQMQLFIACHSYGRM